MPPLKCHGKIRHLTTLIAAAAEESAVAGFCMASLIKVARRSSFSTVGEVMFSCFLSPLFIFLTYVRYRRRKSKDNMATTPPGAYYSYVLVAAYKTRTE
jgi:hypothetical protein